MREATSARVAHMLREKGFDAYVIVGGLRAWMKSGYALEPVPGDDLVLLQLSVSRLAHNRRIRLKSPIPVTCLG